MRRDTRLRWASLLVVRWDEVWSESSAGSGDQPAGGDDRGAGRA